MNRALPFPRHWWESDQGGIEAIEVPVELAVVAGEDALLSKRVRRLVTLEAVNVSALLVFELVRVALLVPSFSRLAESAQRAEFGRVDVLAVRPRHD